MRFVGCADAAPCRCRRSESAIVAVSKTSAEEASKLRAVSMAATPSFPHVVDARDLPRQACSAHRLAPRQGLARTGLGIGRIYSRVFDPSGAFSGNHAESQGIPPGETNDGAAPLIAKRSVCSMKIFVTVMIMALRPLSGMAAAETGNA